jgi:hypothetical protein
MSASLKRLAVAVLTLGTVIQLSAQGYLIPNGVAWDYWKQISSGNLLVSGNTFSLYSALSISDDHPGGAVNLWQADRVNVSGNTMLAGGSGLITRGACTNVLVLKNDFASAEQLAVDCIGQLGYNGVDSSGALLDCQVFKNDLGCGVSFHLRAPLMDGTRCFAGQNTFLDSSGSPMNPFTEPLALPVHYQP